MLARLTRLERTVLLRRRQVDQVVLARFVLLLDRQFSTHMAAEDAVVYPALSEALPEVRAVLQPLIDDHVELRGMLADLTAMLATARSAARDERMLVVVRDLIDLLRLHIHKEETIVFALASRVLGAQAVSELMRRFSQEPVTTRSARRSRRKGSKS